MAEETAEGVIGRKLVFCGRLQTFERDKLIRTCEICSRFLVYCCSCSKQFQNDGRSPAGCICHHFKLIFTDGACRQNGQIGATAGIGLACGDEDGWQISMSITKDVDPGQKRTSQRAELLAAIAGLQFLVDVDRVTDEHVDGKPKNKTRKKGRKPSPLGSDKAWIVATDSEYVVKGMTEWLPAWKENNLRTKRNTKPANLDLFLKLDEELTAQEMKQDVKIGFWHVPREYNTIADGLAKKAALDGEPEESSG